MKYLKTISFPLVLLGLFSLIFLKKENKIKYFKNNLSKELEMIDDKKIDSNEIDIDNLLNEHGFLKEKYNNLKDNDKINYSLIHGYL